MRRIKNYDLERAPNERTVLKYRDKRGKHEVELSCGYYDEVEAFKERDRTFVLSWNDRLEYAGVECFKGHEKLSELFIQDSQDIEAVLGKHGLELTPMTIVKRLAKALEMRVRKAEGKGL